MAHKKREGGGPPVTTPAGTTTTTTTIATPESCPEEDDSYCRCGPVRNNNINRFGKLNRMPVRIIGGRPSEPHQYPYQVVLTYYGYLFCGGSLITPRHVLTAAHCTDYMLSIDFEVLLKNTNRAIFHSLLIKAMLDFAFPQIKKI
jgi:hypothetical protein